MAASNKISAWRRGAASLLLETARPSLPKARSAGPLGNVAGPIGFQFGRGFADLGPFGHSVLSTSGPLCATFDLGTGSAVIIGDEECCNKAPGRDLCGDGFLPDATRETLFMNCIAAVLLGALFEHVPAEV